MLVRKLGDCEEFVAGDNSILRELLHPELLAALAATQIASISASNLDFSPRRLLMSASQFSFILCSSCDTVLSMSSAALALSSPQSSDRSSCGTICLSTSCQFAVKIRDYNLVFGDISGILVNSLSKKAAL